MLQDLQLPPSSTYSFKTEESIVFRVLVQLMVIVGIIATDVAAGTYMSLWGIPLSIIGAIWGYNRRKDRNITAKFFLAIGMIGALFIFLNKLVTNPGDTRLLLAELLVQLQVLHSFDIPRRKDLGYSMVIGLILLAVAGTISQTMFFGLWLLLFLAIALPTLVLDYRSRLGFDPIEKHLQNKPKTFSLQSQRLTQRFSKLSAYSPLPPKQLGLFLLITLVLGLIVFISLPRVPGYKLQSFPVSSPVNSENQRFDQDNRSISNPGYVREGQANSGQGEGSSPLTGKGQVDQTQYYGFNPTMNQNLRGEMTPKVVLRVRSQAPGFWKVMSFDRYTGQGWEISDQKEITEIDSVWTNYRFHLPNFATLAQTKRIVQTYTAVSYLPNVIPALYYPKFVFFPAQQIAMDNEGSLRAPLGLLEGLTYTVISEVPYRNSTALSQAKGMYPTVIEERYLEIPEASKAKIREKAIELLQKSPKPIDSAYAASVYLAQQLKTQYEIKPDFPFLEDNEDLVEAFLRYGGGYPDHFSTVLTVMLRSIGIPARLTTGFAPGQFNPFTGFYIVRNTDAYALTEVYFPNYGWYGFDPIPGHELIPPSFTEYETFGVVRQFWNWIAGFLPPPVAGFISFVWNKLIQGLFTVIGGIWSLISGSIWGMMIGIMGAIALGFLGWIGWLKLKTWGWYRKVAKLPPMAQIYQQMLRLMQQKGYPKAPSQTPLEYVQVCKTHHNSEIADIIETISQGYMQWRYGEIEQNTDYLQQQLQLLKRGFKQ